MVGVAITLEVDASTSAATVRVTMDIFTSNSGVVSITPTEGVIAVVVKNTFTVTVAIDRSARSVGACWS